MRLLRESIEASELEVATLSGGGGIFNLPRKKKRRSPADLDVQTDLGMLFELDVSSDDEEADDLDEEEDQDAAEQAATPKAGKTIAISADTRLLAIRCCLYDPKKAKEGGFEPFVVAAVLSTIARKPRTKKAKAKGSPDQSGFQIRRTGLLHMLRVLEPATRQDQSIAHHIPAYDIAANVAAIVHRALATFDSEEAVNNFVAAVVDSVNSSSP